VTDGPIARNPPTPLSKHGVLTGWGHYPSAESDIYRPEKLAELAAVVSSNSTSLIPRGAGRAYGDAALNDGNRVLDMQRLDRMLAFDPESGLLRCEAGVTLAEIIEVFLRRGYFPTVVPGTQFVTVGGSVAADVHGKSHHRDSSLATHVTSIELMLASGEVKRCSREENPELFWATVGGMGLTGVILEVEMRLRPVESAWFDGEIVMAANLDEAIETFERTERQYGYSVAWIDSSATGAKLGRSVVNLGNVATREALPPPLRQQPLQVPARFQPSVPFNLPSLTLSPFSIRTFNAAYYAIHRAGPRLFDYQSFFFPLDSIHNSNRVYGPRGFVQYQCVWPPNESRAGLIETLEAIARWGGGSPVTVLKKFGAQEGMLSFPMPGYTLALDFPVTKGLLEFLDQLDAMVLKRGGRIYLAKDARMKPNAFREMYPNLPRWQEVKRAVDPENRLSSSLARRVGMLPA
jgi:decaprenylphospho-beta-D-ribofuranose 2-oxidase